MSYDINFWKQSRSLKLSPEQIYHKLCEGESVEGLDVLPISYVYSRLQAEFPTFDPAGALSLIEFEDCGIEVSSSPQHVRFDIRGEIGDPLNKVVQVMSAFGCPMYDPQVNKRYDKNRGTQVGQPPRFEDASSRNRSREVRKQAAARLLEKIEIDRSVKPIDELTKEEAHFIELEHRGFWLSDVTFYQEHVVDNAVMVFPRPVGVVGREQVVLAIQFSSDPRWADLVISDVRCSRLSGDATLMVYHAEARHTTTDLPYSALICSIYTNQGGHWKLAFHQQTPDMEIRSLGGKPKRGRR